METTKKSRKKPGSAGPSVANIKPAYIDYLLTQGKRPPSVYKFCADLGIPEEAFYSQFGSFDGLERDIWSDFIDKTIERLTADETYAQFSAREKVLAFYYAFFEELKANRSFVLVQLESHRKPELIPEFLKDFKSQYESFLKEILDAGRTGGEVARRPYLDKQYPQLFWFHMAFMLLFWKIDGSAGFEKTDAAIEKSVNLAFDLIGKGAVDSAIDFIKFLYQVRFR